MEILSDYGFKGFLVGLLFSTLIYTILRSVYYLNEIQRWCQVSANMKPREAIKKLKIEFIFLNVVWLATIAMILNALGVY